MPKLLRARPPLDREGECPVRKLARSRHAPSDWIRRARMIARSWDRRRTTEIAHELQCHPQTVRERLLRFNAEGLDGLGDRPGPGRQPRLTEAERSTIVELVATAPPGRLLTPADGRLVATEPEREAHWTLAALTATGSGAGHRRRPEPGPPDPGAGRRALAATSRLGDEYGFGVRPTRTTIVELYTAPPADATVLCVGELGPVSPRTFPPAPGWSLDGHRIKAPWSTVAGRTQSGSTGLCACAMGRR